MLQTFENEFVKNISQSHFRNENLIYIPNPEGKTHKKFITFCIDGQML